MDAAVGLLELPQSGIDIVSGAPGSARQVAGGADAGGEQDEGRASEAGLDDPQGVAGAQGGAEGAGDEGAGRDHAPGEERMLAVTRPSRDGGQYS